MARRTRSFEPNASQSVTLPSGQIAHELHVEQSHRLARTFSEVCPGVWCFVGNGLSNQSFIDAPDGIIAIDTGESIEEMNEAIAELRKVSQRPIVAVMYTHFHYVDGTKAVIAENNGKQVPIWGHEKIAENRRRTASEIAPAYGRGLVEQFAMQLPEDGEDGRVNVGLGHFYRNPQHAPFTPGFIEPTHTFGAAAKITVAGLNIEVTHAPSDADDSVTYWIPSLGVAVNNLVWPVLFNVFAIRGEEYRDPRILLKGIDHLLSLNAAHLVGAHGPHLSGVTEIATRVTKYRDSIQFMWDQTVRATNAGMTSTEIAESVDLPETFDGDYLTSELYGVVEHHVRQIRTGLFGFFDGDEANLFPTPPRERSARLIAGFGGRDAVRKQVDEALTNDDARWALELGSWLVRSDGAEDADRALLARALRMVAQRTSAANIRNWCLTRARVLDGTANVARLKNVHLRKPTLLSAGYEKAVHILRVLLVPERAKNVDMKLKFVLDGNTTGLHIRNFVAVPYSGVDAQATITGTLDTWTNVLSGSTTLAAVISDGLLSITGDSDGAVSALRCFDVKGLAS
ncbi:MAG: alkyl sulfatase dimerization domain-containing protein [Ilumatobacteraceae bacterium]